MLNTRQFILEAKQTKYIPAAQRVQKAKKSLAKLQMHMQKVNQSIGKINSSKGPTKLKQLRIQKAKALQGYLKAAINHKNAEIKQITNPE